MRTSLKPRIAVILVGAGIVIHGCSRESTVVPPVPADTWFATTPDMLMENFEKAYTAMDLEGYERLLREDFVFGFRAIDVKALGLAADHDTRADELATTAHMFARTPYVKASGRIGLPAAARRRESCHVCPK